MRGPRLQVLFMALFFLGVLPAAEARGEKRIGVLIWSEQARYRESLNAILEELKKNGFDQRAVTLTVENAQSSRAKVAEVARRFAQAKLDLIIAVGTNATLAVTKETKETPIVFTEVYDPVEVRIASGWQSSGNNVTGSTTKVPMGKVLATLKAFAPVKRLAVLYTPGEKNSEVQLKDLQGQQGSSGVKVIPVIVTRDEEVPQILPGVTHMADAIYLTGSSVVGNMVPKITEAASRSKVVTVTHLDDLVDKGGLLGVCPNASRLGHMAGRHAVKILKGAKPSALPIETDQKLEVLMNMRTVKAGNFQVSPTFMKKVNRVR